MSLLAELRRRNVIRVAGLYLVGAWLAVQVAGTLLPVFEAPPWVMKTLVGLLAVGFVPALVFSWVFEFTPQGIKRDDEVPPGQSIAPQTARRMDRTIIAVLALALAYFGFDKFVLQQRPESAPGAAPAPAAAPVPKSIAVLPFLALSKGEDDGYFADGVTEEILTALAQLPDLLVTARTSAFHFKGKDVPIPEIARQLGVAHVLEGSVRRQGDKVRITAQLIRARDGFHLWSENYDRDAKDTIAVQDDIAQHVAAALDVLLDDDRRAAMHRVATGDVEAFVSYQKGMDLYLRAHLEREGAQFEPLLRQSQAAFDQALARVPNLFPAQLLRGDVYNHQLLDPLLYLGPALPPAEARAALAALREGNARTQAAARNEDERASASVTRIYLSDDWTGLAAAATRLFGAQGCVETVFNDAALAYGLADAARRFYQKQIACDPLELEYYWSQASALLWLGDYAGVASLVAQDASRAEHDFRLEWIQMLALVGSGKGDQAAALTGTVAPRARFSPEAYAILIAAARGDAGLAHKRWAALPQAHHNPRLDLTASAWLGERDAASDIAARLDGEALGAVGLAEIVRHCYCGAPFDLDRTPNFKARIAESGFAWPPKKPVPTPLKDW